RTLDKKACQEIAEGYSRIWTRGGSRLKLNAIFEQIKFIYDVASDAQDNFNDLARGLLDIREMLKKATR
ncbi:MAG TPA: hypothetical protein PKZ99_09795, partial [Azospirillaceae bacterium]|nr:hypothetical protein [Azospirillaceae bacterium]